MFFEKKQPTSLSMDDLAKIAAGYIVSQLIPKGKDEIEHLQNGLPYAKAVLDYMRNETPDEEKIQELRVSVRTIPCLLEATWNDLPIEERIILTVAEMHNAWRTQYEPKRRDPQWFMCMPLAFIGWKKAEAYCDALVPITECLGIGKLDNGMLQRAYYEYSANELYKYGFNHAYDLSHAMHTVACIPAEITRLSSEKRELLDNSKFVSRSLCKQLTEFGIGGFNKMRDLAATFDHLGGAHDRRLVGDLLMKQVVL